MHSAKGILRAKAQKEREQFSTSLGTTKRERCSRQICDLVLASIPIAKDAVVATYWPMKHEVDPRYLNDALCGAGHKMALPVVQSISQPLIFKQFRVGDTLEEGMLGIKQPSNKAPTLEPEVLLIPMLAFDLRGHRLGYGAGHYDRTLAQLCKKRTFITIGLAYEMQRVNELPVTPQDVPLNWIVTEERLYHFEK